jgi:hypothetical protein
VPLRRFLSPASIRWVVRHRAWTPYHLVRYWRFLVLRVRHPHVVTEGMVYLGRGVELKRFNAWHNNIYHLQHCEGTS